MLQDLHERGHLPSASPDEEEQLSEDQTQGKFVNNRNRNSKKELAKCVVYLCGRKNSSLILLYKLSHIK